MPISKSSRTGPSPPTESRQSTPSPRQGSAQRRLDFSPSQSPIERSQASRPPESTRSSSTRTAEPSSPPAQELNDSRRSSRSRQSLKLIEDLTVLYQMNTSNFQFKDWFYKNSWLILDFIVLFIQYNSYSLTFTESVMTQNHFSWLIFVESN